MQQSHSLLMSMHHYHMILVRVFVLQNLSAQLAVLAGGGIVKSFNVSSAAASCPKFFSTAEATPSTTTLQCHNWLTFLIYFTCNVIKISDRFVENFQIFRKFSDFQIFGRFSDFLKIFGNFSDFWKKFQFFRGFSDFWKIFRFQQQRQS